MKGYHHYRARYGAYANSRIVPPWHKRQMDLSPSGVAGKLAVAFGVMILLLLLAALAIMFVTI